MNFYQQQIHHLVVLPMHLLLCVSSQFCFSHGINWSIRRIVFRIWTFVFHNNNLLIFLLRLTMLHNQQEHHRMPINDRPYYVAYLDDIRRKTKQQLLNNHWKLFHQKIRRELSVVETRSSCHRRESVIWNNHTSFNSTLIWNIEATLLIIARIRLIIMKINSYYKVYAMISSK